MEAGAGIGGGKGTRKMRALEDTVVSRAERELHPPPSALRRFDPQAGDMAKLASALRKEFDLDVDASWRAAQRVQPLIEEASLELSEVLYEARAREQRKLRRRLNRKRRHRRNGNSKRSR
jgi:hypothetical protein